ncbi:MAG: L-threonylcarbamoyladenylate synthase [Candidatus Krumholzibacteriia bacterium]
MTTPSGANASDPATRLAEGAVLLLNTDTLPGLHARIDRPEALESLARLKGRATDQPLLVLVADLATAAALMAGRRWSDHRLLAACWPGPFTFIVPAATGLPSAVCSALGTVAIRIPDRPPLRRLLARTGPLASSSANRHGEAPSLGLAEARRRFADLEVWDDGAPASAGAASALVDLTGAEPRVLRPGPRPLPVVADGS